MDRRIYKEDNMLFISRDRRHANQLSGDGIVRVQGFVVFVKNGKVESAIENLIQSHRVSKNWCFVITCL
ncbi:MAG: hypothetical protein WCF23_15855 [Candidatus Nitrosopolaris sp.]